MTESTVVFLPSAEGVEDPLTEVLRAGARQLVRHAVEAEVAALLAAYADHRTETGRRRLVRHGHGPEREILTGSGTRFPHFPPAHIGTWSLLERTAPWRTSGAGPRLELQEPPAYLPAPVWPTRARRPKPHRLGHTMPGSKTNPVSTVTGLHTEFLTVLKALDTFAAKYQAKYPKAVTCLTKDREALLAFYDFPAEHWQHIRTTNPIESVFATVRHRTVRSKGCLSHQTALAMVFKLVTAASKTWRRLNGYEKLPRVLQGVKFTDGIQADETETRAAA